MELFLTPGHSLGSQSIVVPTTKGRYVLTGDIPSAKYALSLFVQVAEEYFP